LLFLFTAPYAAPPQQPIFSGCCGEWLTPNTKEGGGRKALFALFVYGTLCRSTTTANLFRLLW